ncbi:MAG: hypothetical protein DMG14_25310 [Acidobacteria bacterium]|nr:MAG: hypothetical protein DMG14_25310 [Acidobacteriota bacterium]
MQIDDSDGFGFLTGDEDSKAVCRASYTGNSIKAVTKRSDRDSACLLIDASHYEHFLGCVVRNYCVMPSCEKGRSRRMLRRQNPSRSGRVHYPQRGILARCEIQQRQAGDGLPDAVDIRQIIFDDVPVLRNIAFASTLYHEVGHHLERTIGAPAPGGEAAAEAWKNRLLCSYLRKSYWYLVPFLGVAKAIVACLGHSDDSGRPRSHGQN